MKKLFTFLILLFYGILAAQKIPLLSTKKGKTVAVQTENRGFTNRATALPYSTDFAVNDFTFVNGTQPNKWYAGTATGNTGSSIYVSNNNGVSNAYNNSSSSTVHAYIDLVIPAGTDFATIKFDWKAVGEGSYDYLSVYLAPDTFTPSANFIINPTNANGIIQLGGKLSEQGTWQTVEHALVDVSSFAGNNMRLIFQWRNDNIVGVNPPAAIDNVEVSIPSCVPPSNTSVVGGTSNSVTVSWNPPSSVPAQGYEYYVNTTGVAPTAATTGTLTTNTTAVLTGIAPHTNYHWWVRSVCSNTEKSNWMPGPVIVLGQIGTGTSTLSELPISSCWGYSYSQMIYTPAEVLSAVGNGRVITKIAYYVSSVAPNQDLYKNWRVYMANSTQNNFPNSTSWISHSQFSQVFEGDIPNHADGQWMELQLDTPFIWDGVSNLVIAVDENTPDYSCTTSWGSFSTGGQNRGITYRNDNTNPDPSSPPPATMRPMYLPQLRITADPLLACSLLPPTNTAAGNITNTGARLTWQASQVDHYVLQWRQVTNPVSQWTTVSPNPVSAFYNITGLTEQTQYEFRVANVCNGTQGAFSLPVMFTTLPLMYCNSGSTVNPSTEFIQNVSVTPTGFPVLPPVSFNSTASSYTDNYLDNTKKIRLVKGSTANTISVAKGFGGNPANVAVSVWIDFDRDGTFDSTEQIFNSPPVNTTPVVGTFDVPAVVHNSQYPTRMRVIARKTNSPSACGNYSDGETEDYAVEFVDFIPCNNSSPQNVVVNNITSTSATINWTADPGGANYVIRYRELGTNTWTNAIPAASLVSTLAINNLTAATSYEVSITAICNGIEGTPTIVTFDTPCSDSPVSGLSISQIDTTSAVVSWNTVPTATYVLQHREVGAAAWQTINLGATTYTLTNLSPNVTYEVRVATVCSGVTNTFGTPEIFTTLPTCEMPPVGLTISNITMTEAFVEWNEIPDATYLLQWRKVGSNAGWNNINVNTNEYLLTGLTENTRYELKIANICNGVQQAFTNVYEFVTPELGYCEMTSTNIGNDYISNVTLKATGFDEVSNSSTSSGYISYIDTPATYMRLIRGSQNNRITINKSWTSAVRNSAITVWIDFNRDGTFSNNERILISPANSQEIVEGTFSVPADSFVTGADDKYTVMRVAMDRGGSPEMCVNAQYGEIEDYRVILSTTNQFEILKQDEINIYPVPAKDFLHITLVEDGTKYTIYNSAGQVVHSGLVYNNKVEISNISSGVYVIDIESQNLGRVSKKFIKN